MKANGGDVPRNEANEGAIAAREELGVHESEVKFAGAVAKLFEDFSLFC